MKSCLACLYLKCLHNNPILGDVSLQIKQQGIMEVLEPIGIFKNV